MSFFDLFIPAASAHEKWFVEMPKQIEISPFWSLNFATFSGALLIMAALWFVCGSERDFWQSAFSKKIAGFVAACRPFAADILGIAIGTTLIAASWQGTLFADNLILTKDVDVAIIRFFQAIIGALLVLGIWSRIAALGLGALTVVTYALFPSFDALDYVSFVGSAVFFWLVPRGRLSLDAAAGIPTKTSESRTDRAVVWVRMTLGINLLVLAMPKLLTPELHFAMLDKYPDFNPLVILQGSGLAFVDRGLYVFCLFVFESLSALLIISGRLLAVIAPLLMSIFAISAVFLGPLEILGHLPIIASLFVLFSYSKPRP